MATRTITSNTNTSAIPSYVDNDTLVISNNAVLTIDNDNIAATLGYGPISIAAGSKIVVKQTAATYGCKFNGDITGDGIFEFVGDPITLLTSLTSIVGNAACVEYSHDGTKIAAGDSWGRCHLFNASTGATIWSNSVTNTRAVAFSLDDTKVIYTYSNTDIKIVDTATGATTYLSKAVTADIVLSVQFSPDGNNILTSGGYKADIWNATTGDLVRTFTVSGYNATAKFSPDGTKVIVASQSNTAVVFDASTGATILTHTYSNGSENTVFTISPDGTKVAATAAQYSNGNVEIWNLSTNAVITNLIAGGRASDIKFSSNGTKIATVTRSAPVLKIWNYADYSLLGSISPPPGDGGVYISFSPNGTKVSTVGGAGKVYDISALGSDTSVPVPINVQLNLKYNTGVSCQLAGASVLMCKEPTIPYAYVKTGINVGNYPQVYVVNSSGAQSHIENDPAWKAGYYIRIDNNSTDNISQEFTITGVGVDGGGTLIQFTPAITSDIPTGSKIILVGRNIMFTGETDGSGVTAFDRVSNSVLNAGYRNFDKVMYQCYANTLSIFAPSGCIEGISTSWNNTFDLCIPTGCNTGVIDVWASSFNELSPSGSVIGAKSITGNNIVKCAPFGCMFGIIAGSYNEIGELSPNACGDAFELCSANKIRSGTFGINTYHLKQNSGNLYKNLTFNTGTIWDQYTPNEIISNAFDEIIDYGGIEGNYNARSAGGNIVNEGTIKPVDRTRSYKQTGDLTVSSTSPCLKQTSLSIPSNRTIHVTVDMYKDWTNGTSPKCEIIDRLNDPLIVTGAIPLATQSLENVTNTWKRYTLSYTNTSTQSLQVLIRTSMCEPSGNFYSDYRWENDSALSIDKVLTNNSLYHEFSSITGTLQLSWYGSSRYYIVYFTRKGTPVTGLTPTVILYKNIADNSDVSNVPTVTEIGEGLYKFYTMPTVQTIIKIDSGDITMLGVDRYKIFRLEPQDTFIDDKSSTIVTNVGIVDGVVDSIKSNTDNIPANPSTSTEVLAIPTNPLLTNDSRLDNIGLIKAVIDKVNTALEIDGSVYKFTINALENAPVTASTDILTLETDVGIIKARVNSIPTNPLLTNDARVPATGVIAKTGDEMALTSAYNAAKTAASQTSVDVIDGIVDGITLKTANLPADPASNTRVDTRMATFVYTAPDNVNIGLIKAVIDKLNTILELNGTTYRLTVDSLFNMPDMDVSALESAIADIPINPLLTNDVRIPATGIGSVDNQTTILNAVNSITSNTARSMPRIPAWFEIPETGSTTYLADLYLFNIKGELEDADNNTVIVHARNSAGTNLDSGLLSTTMTRVSVGRYRLNYTITDTAEVQPIYFDYTWSIGSVNMADGGVVVVASVNMTDAISRLQESIDAVPTNPLLTNDARIPATGVIAKVGDEMALTTAYNAAKTAATQASVDVVDGVVDGITLKTANLPVDPASNTHVSTRMATFVYTAPDNANIGIAKAILDKVNSALELDGSNYRFTVNALENAPVTAAADTSALELAVAAIPTNPLLANDARVPATGVIAKAGDEMALTAAYNAAKNAASQTSVDVIDGIVDGITLKTANLPIDPASNTHVSTRMATFTYTAPDNMNIDLIKAVIDKINSTLELDGAVYRFTVNALENAPDTDTSALELVVAAIPTNPLLTNDARIPATGVISSDSNVLAARDEVINSITSNNTEIELIIDAAKDNINETINNTNTSSGENLTTVKEEIIADVRAGITEDHGTGSYRAEGGSGDKYDYVICNDAEHDALQGVTVRVTLDDENEDAFTIARGVSIDDGKVWFTLETDVIYRFWQRKPGYTFNNPTVIKWGLLNGNLQVLSEGLNDPPIVPPVISPNLVDYILCTNDQHIAVPGVTVRVTAIDAEETDHTIARSISLEDGKAWFNLERGVTYRFWQRKSGLTFTNPAEIEWGSL